MLALLAFTFVGCAGTYRSGYDDYAPKPVDLAVGEAGRLLMSVPGVRRAEDGVRGEAVELRLKLENQGDQVMRIEPRGLVLTTADLVELGVPEMQPSEGLMVEPGERGTATAYFFPPDAVETTSGAINLDGMSVRVNVQVGERTLTQTATFTRQRDERGRRGGVGLGVGIGVGL